MTPNPQMNSDKKILAAEEDDGLIVKPSSCSAIDTIRSMISPKLEALKPDQLAPPSIFLEGLN